MKTAVVFSVYGARAHSFGLAIEHHAITSPRLLSQHSDINNATDVASFRIPVCVRYMHYGRWLIFQQGEFPKRR